MRRILIAVIAAVLAVCCVLGVLFFRNFYADGNGATADSAHVVFRTDQSKTVTIEKGESMVLELSSDDEKALSRWQSSDSSVVGVDSGGRIDAYKEGAAVVYASFSDGHTYTYRVAVEKASAKPQTDVYSTAITANEDILKKNLKEHPPRATEQPDEWEESSGDEYYGDEYYDDRDYGWDYGADDYFEEMAVKTTANIDPDILPYEIQVNRKQNCVTVFTYDSKGNYTVPVRAMVCSCGKDGRTITGEFTIYLKTLWHPLVNDVFGQYISGFSGDFLFHSVPYEDLSKSTLEIEEFNKLGEPASQGCVRLSVADSRWIYENCGEGTVVKIYDSDDPLPLGKPEAIRIGKNAETWDPTDRDDSNPYNGKTPVISGAEDKTISVGSDYKMTDGVTATNSCGADATGEMEIIGNVVPARAGVYKVTYRITDALHRSTRKDITVTVKV